MYEENPGTVINNLQTSSSEVFDPALIAAIVELTVNGNGDKIVVQQNVNPSASGAITVPAGVELAFVTPDANSGPLTVNGDIDVVILQGTQGVVLTVDAGDDATPSPAGEADRVVVGTAGADKIIIADNHNTLVVAGDGDTVQAGDGYDTIVAAQGDSTIIGAGGHDIVRMDGSEENYSVNVVGGHAIVERDNGNQTIDISKIQYVQLENGDALVFARNTLEAAVTTLYQTAFGRTADSGGLEYWFDLARQGVSLSDIAKMFTMTSEYSLEAVGNEVFVNQLYMNTFGRDAEAAGLAYWNDRLESGATRDQLIEAFSTIAAHHIDGSQTVNLEAEVVGSVTLVTGILG